MNPKPCISCLNSLPLDDFYTHPQMRDGHLNKCKSCCRRDARGHRSANLERIREYDRNRPNRLERLAVVNQYSKTPEGQEALRRTKIDWNHRNAHKKKAQVAVNNAVRDGRLIKPSHCESCGALGKIEGHHDDYSLPLIVRWLCDPCHKEHHKRMRDVSRKVAA